jgi:elongator complex protein 4
MSFRKRSTPLASTARASPTSTLSAASTDSTAALRTVPGIRTSTILSLPTTSTGTPTLDTLLGLGTGLPLGHSLAIEEHGTTDFAGALLRIFVSQGVVLGQKVFVGAAEAWSANLPGVRQESGPSKNGTSSESVGAIAKEVQRGEKMKIAWRYERLGMSGEEQRRGALLNALYFMRTHSIYLERDVSLSSRG